MQPLFSSDSHVVEIDACYAQIDPKFSQDRKRDRGIHDLVGGDVRQEGHALVLRHLARGVFTDGLKLGRQRQTKAHHFVIVHAQKDQPDQ